MCPGIFRVVLCCRLNSDCSSGPVASVCLPRYARDAYQYAAQPVPCATQAAASGSLVLVPVRGAVPVRVRMAVTVR